MLGGPSRGSSKGAARLRNIGVNVWITRDSEVSQLSSPLKCLMARTIAAEDSVTGD